MASKFKQQLTFLGKKVTEAKEAYVVAAKEAFKEGTKEIFDKYPLLQSFSWTQYTPYFNDGDPCTFRCHCGYPDYTMQDEKGEAIEFEEGYLDDEDKGRFPTFEVMAKEVTGFLELIESEVYEDLFGDGVRVTVSRTGTSTDEYDHD